MNYFDAKELECKCGCGTNRFDDNFKRLLNRIRDDFAKPMIITSAYRCPDHPIEKRKEKPGAHGLGVAVDVAVSGGDALELIRVAQEHGIQRIGVQQKGSGRFIHLDVSTAEHHSRPAIWSY